MPVGNPYWFMGCVVSVHGLLYSRIGGYKMPLKFKCIGSRKGYTRVHYQDEFGQPRFFEFTDGFDSDMDHFAQELIQQVNELLARPRPAEGTVKQGGVTFNCNVRPLSAEDEIALRAEMK